MGFDKPLEGLDFLMTALGDQTHQFNKATKRALNPWPRSCAAGALSEQKNPG